MTPKEFRRVLIKRRYYYPDGFKYRLSLQNRWRIRRWQFIGEEGLILLCQKGQEYAVFSWHSTRPGYYPADKFTSGRKSGQALYREILADCIEEEETTTFLMGKKCPGCADTWAVRVRRSEVRSLQRDVRRAIPGKCTFCGTKFEVKIVGIPVT